MAGGRPSRSHARDDNWAKFEEYAQQRESMGEGIFPSSRNPLSPTSGRLHKEDMAIYGREPATDHMVLVVCEVCHRAVKSQAFMRHKELYHPETLKGPPSGRTPVQTLGQSSAFVGGVANGSVSEGGGGRKKGFDVDRHCGVWMENEKKYCKKSISCKIHSLEQRRKVVGRSRPLSELIAEYKKNKKMKKIERMKMASQPGLPLTSPVQTPTSANHLPVSPSSPFSPQSPKGEVLPLSRRDSSPPHSSIKFYFEDVEVEEVETGHDEELVMELLPSVEEEAPDEQLYPKPAAVASFGGRVTTGCGSTNLFTHRLDTLRSSLVFLTGRESDLSDAVSIPDASVRRRYSNSINSHRVQQKRKYAHLSDQNHILLAKSKFSLPSHPFTMPPIASNMATPTSSTSITTNSFYSSKHSDRQLNVIQAVITSSSSVDEALSSEDRSPSTQNRPKRSRKSSKTDLAPDKHQGSLYHPAAPNKSNPLNHFLETHSSPLILDSDEETHLLTRPDSLASNHLENWAENISEPTPTVTSSQNFQQVKMVPPVINGVMGSPNSLGGMVQPFSLNSQQTYLINPSQQQPHLFSRRMVPLGLGVPRSPNSSYPVSGLGVPALYPGDKSEQGLLQLMSQNRMTMHPVGGGGTELTDEENASFAQTTRISEGAVNNSLFNSERLGNQSNPYMAQSKQNQPHHQYSAESHLNEYGNLGNQYGNPANQYANFMGMSLPQYGNQSSPGNMSKLSSHSPSSLTLHQMTTGGLVQSSPDLPSHIPVPNLLPPPLLPPPPPSASVPPSQTTNPSLHLISQSGKQNSYLHPQPGMVTTQNSAHRTQRVS